MILAAAIVYLFAPQDAAMDDSEVIACLKRTRPLFALAVRADR
jgi:hypothetical protein